MENIKKFFGIHAAYKFEWNDLRAIVQIINVLLIMRFGLSISWFGLAVAIFGFIKDLTSDRHLNGILMHVSSIVLNVCFITLLSK